MKQFITLFTLFFVLIAPATIFSQQPTSQAQMITVDPSDLDAATLAKVKAKQAEADLKQKIDSYGKWVGIGKEVGVAVDEGLTAVTKHATAIADTRLGKITMFIIAYKVVGNDIIRIILGLTIWFILTVMFVISFWKNCMGKKIRNISYQDDGKTIKTIKEDYISADGERMMTHAAFYGLAIVVCCLVMFVG